MPRKHIVTDDTCTFCETPLQDVVVQKYSDGAVVPCVCCGKYFITGTAMDVAPNWNLSEWKWTAISYRLRRMTDSETVPRVDSDVLKSLRDHTDLPGMDELIDQIILWLGTHAEFPGQAIDITYPKFKAVFGAVNFDAFNKIADSLETTGWIAGIRSQNIGPVARPFIDCYLTPAGWQQFRALALAAANSRQAFMAMKYGDSQLDAIVETHFAPAIKRTGLELRRLDQGQPAGLIDDQLRVQIRTSRLLICDLTHGNRGAYWEAGFAEGLGRPVIYTCREDVFNDAKHLDHPHFDTNHFVTVVWNAGDPEPAAQKLVNTIRATLPGEVVMQD